MKLVLKIVAYIIDVVLMPIRALLTLEVMLTGAIFADISVKYALVEYCKAISQYPSQLMQATKIIFEKD